VASVRQWLIDWLGEADAALLGRVHAAVSVDAESVRRWLRASGHPFVDPEGSAVPQRVDIERTAAWVIDQSRLKLAALGGVAGIAGAASVPPEVLASTIAGLRLAQRLAVVYGFDPATDRGAMAVWQALAAGFEVELPHEGPVSMRVRDVPAVLVKGARARYPAGALATAVMRQTAWQIGARITRWLAVPVLSAGLSAIGAHRRFAEVGVRMRDALARVEAPPVDPMHVLDAVEVG